MDFQEINRERVRQKRSVFELCRSADVAYSTWWFVQTGRFEKWQPRTLAKLRAALALAPRVPLEGRAPAPSLIASTYRGYVAAIAAKLGEDPEKVLGLDPGKKATANADWARAAEVRSIAVYCTVTEFDLPGAQVARAIGLTKQAVSQMLRRVEDSRDDLALDEIIERTGSLISGRAAA